LALLLLVLVLLVLLVLVLLLVLLLPPLLNRLRIEHPFRGHAGFLLPKPTDQVPKGDGGWLLR
jgi:hypothetical protein